MTRGICQTLGKCRLGRSLSTHRSPDCSLQTIDCLIPNKWDEAGMGSEDTGVDVPSSKPARLASGHADQRCYVPPDAGVAFA